MDEEGGKGYYVGECAILFLIPRYIRIKNYLQKIVQEVGVAMPKE